jgi:hypothetical protein
MVLRAGPRLGRDKIVSIGASLLAVDQYDQEVNCIDKRRFDFKVQIFILTTIFMSFSGMVRSLWISCVLGIVSS